VLSLAVRHHELRNVGELSLTVSCLQRNTGLQVFCLAAATRQTSHYLILNSVGGMNCLNLKACVCLQLSMFCLFESLGSMSLCNSFSFWYFIEPEVSVSPHRLLW